MPKMEREAVTCTYDWSSSDSDDFVMTSLQKTTAKTMSLQKLLGRQRSKSYSLALDNPVLPTLRDSPLPTLPHPLSLPPTVVPLLPTFPVLTPHCMQLSLSPLTPSPRHAKHPSPTHRHSVRIVPSSHIPLSLLPPLSHSLTHSNSHARTAASVNYPTTAAEIIELLRKNICFLSGGRAKEGQSLITFPAKEKNFEYDRDNLRKVIQYLASIPM